MSSWPLTAAGYNAFLCSRKPSSPLRSAPPAAHSPQWPGNGPETSRRGSCICAGIVSLTRPFVVEPSE